MKKIYISHAYGGKEDNVERVTDIINYYHDQMYRDDIVLVSPIHIFRKLYPVISYELGLEVCLDLLEKCDEMWVFDDYSESVGVHREIDFCKSHSIPYVIFDSNSVNFKSDMAHEFSKTIERQRAKHGN